MSDNWFSTTLNRSPSPHHRDTSTNTNAKKRNRNSNTLHKLEIDRCALHMDNSSTNGTKRPAEPGLGPVVQPQAKPKPKTLRMSSIPIGVTNAYLSRTLEGLQPIRTSLIANFLLPTGAKQRRETNIDYLSLAPDNESDQYPVATVTFKDIPGELEDCVSENGSGITKSGEEGEEFFKVDVDSHFHGLTPLNHVINPSVEYAVTSQYLVSTAYLTWELVLSRSLDSLGNPSVPGGHGKVA